MKFYVCVWWTYNSLEIFDWFEHFIAIMSLGFTAAVICAETQYILNECIWFA